MAKYSRSSQGMLESIAELSQQKAEQFLNTFYFQYGHRSIADLAHLVFGLEQISILAAIAVVDEQVWDGQERSTRYQPFRSTGWYTPPLIQGGAGERVYGATIEALFAAYEGLTSRLLEHLLAAVPRPEGMAEGVFRRTLRARAFDVSRSLLPLATHTSVGQVVSARVVERQISRLLGSPYAEVRQVGQELKSACQLPSESPLLKALVSEGGDWDSLVRPPAAPTLVKYAERSPFQEKATEALRQAAATLLAGTGEAERSGTVTLADSAPPLDEIVATLLYRHDAGGRSYRQVAGVVADMPEAQKREVLDLSLEHRGRHDDLAREHQAGYALVFDVLMDLGSFRDLHRHRRAVQVQQAYTWQHGFDPPPETFEAGLGAQVAQEALDGGLGDLYTETLAKAQQAATLLGGEDERSADYLLPLGYKVRCLFKMDFAQAAYMIEQRTAPAGHFSYRRVAWGMFEALRQKHPGLAAAVRATDPFGPLDLLQR